VILVEMKSKNNARMPECLKPEMKPIYTFK